jgi:hypothetical protein
MRIHHYSAKIDRKQAYNWWILLLYGYIAGIGKMLSISQMSQYRFTEKGVRSS